MKLLIILTVFGLFYTSARAGDDKKQAIALFRGPKVFGNVTFTQIGMHHRSILRYTWLV